MKLKGIVKITIADINGSIKYEITEQNLIPDSVWVAILASNITPSGIGSSFFGSKNISIATDSTTPVASVDVVTGVIGTTTAVPPSPIWVESVDPPYGTITGRINPVGTSRVFNSVALTSLGSADVQSIASTPVAARLKLSIPCTQDSNDFVNITYSIQFLDNVGDGFLSKDLNRYDLGRALFGFGNYQIGSIRTCLCNPNYSAIELPATVDTLTIASGTASNINYKWNYLISRDRNVDLGIILNAITQGLSNSGNKAYALTQYLYDKSPFQTGFKKTSLSVLPFFDAGNIASSQGSIILGGTWNKKIPEIYKIQFTSTGITGVATYKFSTIKHTGFVGNTYTPRNNQTLYRCPGYKFVSTLHGWREEDFDVHRLDDYTIVQYDTTGVSIVDIIDGTNTTYDATSTPALPATDIRQIAVDTTNRLIYCADRLSGLFIINLTANTVTQQFSQPCYGVDVGRNNVAVALINGGLYQSTNWITPVSFTFVGITDSNWNRVRFLKADPEHPNDRIAIVADNGSGTNRVVWYQFSDNTATLGYQASSVKSYPGGLDVSDTGSHWVIYGNNSFGSIVANKMTYGANTLSTGYSAIGLTFNHSVWGTDKFSKVSFYKDNYLGSNQLYGGSNSQSYSKFNASSENTTFILHMEGGVCLASNSFANIDGTPTRLDGLLVQLLPSIAEVSYGWDGTNWVIGNTNSKTTHSTDQALINGLTIRFQDGSNPPHFVNTEVFTESVNYGLLKDNATSYELRTAWYSKAIRNTTISPTTIATTVTLPDNSNPIFRRVDTDSNSPHRIYINGVLVTKLWLAGESPGIGEASFPASGAAILTFNIGDVGKTLSGSFVWIEV